MKKHEKIHTEEHHAQHKHSKAITVVDPAYVTRVRGDGKPTSSQSLRVPVRAASHSSSGSDSSNFLLPTPSPELAPAHHHYPNQSPTIADVSLQSHLPSWEVLDQPVSAGLKRSYDHDYSVDDFFTDMKKRRVNPSYDTRMAERLSNLAYAHHVNGGNNPTGPFNPRSVSLDIRTPEELAAVNQFLVTLGRDVSGTIRSTHSHQSHHGHSSSVPNIPPDYFDPVTLSQMGLAGMPGISAADDFVSSPTYSSNHPSHHYYPGQRHQSYGSSMYPTMNDVGFGPQQHGPETMRRSSVHQQHKYSQPPSSMSNGYSSHHHNPYHHQPTPPLEASTGSPHSSSSASSPVATTPPQMTLSMPATMSNMGPSPDSAAAFDYLRPSRGPGPVIGLVPGDYTSKSMRSIVPLKTAPGSPAASTSSPAPTRRSLTPAPTPASNVSKTSSLYPLLNDGDAQYKLPPLRHRSPSPPSSSRESTPGTSSSSSSSSGSPVPSNATVLPSLRVIHGEGDQLATGVDKLGLSAEEKPPRRVGFFDVVEKRNVPLDDRLRHLETIKDLLLRVNKEYQARNGTPKTMVVEKVNVDRDVEMVAVA